MRSYPGQASGLDVVKTHGHLTIHLIDGSEAVRLAGNNLAVPSSTASRDRTRPGRGTMSRLPLEIMYFIFSNLTFERLIRVSAINSQLCEEVNGFVLFREVKLYIPNVLLTLACKKMSDIFTITYLHNLLHDDRCKQCSRNGPFLFLPTVIRCCWACAIMYRPDERPQKNAGLFDVLSLRAAQEAFGLQEWQIRQLPHRLVRRKLRNQHSFGEQAIRDVHSLPSIEEEELYSAFEIQELARSVYQDDEKIMLNLSKFYETQLKPPDIRDIEIDYVERTLDAIMIMSRKHYYDEKLVLCPYFNNQGELEHGFWCSACRWQIERLAAFKVHRKEQICITLQSTRWKPFPWSHNDNEFFRWAFELLRKLWRSYSSKGLKLHLQNCAKEWEDAWKKIEDDGRLDWMKSNVVG